MEAAGLVPSDTGEPGGKKTGQQMTHYIESGGAFQAACNDLLQGGFKLSWQATTTPGKHKKKSESKIKYSCEICGLNAWAKPEASFFCGICNKPMEEFS